MKNLNKNTKETNTSNNNFVLSEEQSLIIYETARSTVRGLDNNDTHDVAIDTLLGINNSVARGKTEIHENKLRNLSATSAYRRKLEFFRRKLPRAARIKEFSLELDKENHGDASEYEYTKNRLNANPEKIYLYKEYLLAIKRALVKTLTNPEDIELLFEKYLDDLSMNEIADQYSTTSNIVKNRLYHARQKLKTSLKDIRNIS